MASNIRLWYFNKLINIQSDIDESIIKISNIENCLYFQTISNRLYYGEIQTNSDNSMFIELKCANEWRIIDLDSCKDDLYLIDIDGNVYNCNRNLEILNEISLNEDYLCSRGHTGTKSKHKVNKLTIGEYGKLFITDSGELWATGCMPQIGINNDLPKKVTFFNGRNIFNANVGNDFAIAIVSKQIKDDDTDEEDVFVNNCPQCLSASQLTSPVSANSISDNCPLGVKLHGSYDIETTSTSSKNDSSISSSDKRLNCDENSEKSDDNLKTEKNIIFRNTEAAKEFLTRQISRMSSAGEEYFVECTEKPTRILKENMTNVASFVYEGVKTVGDKVVILSRHVSGSSDCNSILEPIDDDCIIIPKIITKDDSLLSLSQCTSDNKDLLLENEIRDRVEDLLRIGSNLINCEVWTWGNIIHGQLGIGDIIKRERPMIITKLSNIGVRRVSVQNYHASVLTLDGRAYIWGRNNYNQVTIDNNIDQSSPKLYNNYSKDERIKDIVCGEYYTTLLTNQLNLIYFGKQYETTTTTTIEKTKKLYNLQLDMAEISNNNENNANNNSRIGVIRNLLSSQQYTLLNICKISNDCCFTNFLLVEQKFLEELLVVQANIIKPLQKKNMSSSNAALFEDLCLNFTNLLYFYATNTQSLLDHSNGVISLNDIIIFKHLDEFIYIYRNYIKTIYDTVSIDGFHNISKLIEISQNLYKLRADICATKKDKNNDELIITTLLLSPAIRLDNYTTIINNYTELINDKADLKTKWFDFIEQQAVLKQQSELTREFWQNSGRSIDFLKIPSRRLLRNSHKYPIYLHNASRFTTHWFILFCDLFVHMNGSTPHLHNLTTIWLEPQQDEQTQQYQICLKMPEDTLILYTNEAEDKIEWFHILQNAIKNALNKNEALQPPTVRHGTYQFNKNGFYKDATYTGRWLNAKMHGNGKLVWTDGKIYTGQFTNNQLCGYGIMEIPNIGTYEGQWKDNQQNGFGIFTYTNTDIYRGHFKDGQPHGHGFLRKGNFMANAASFYIGDWVCGMKNGYGVMDDIVSGEKYIGNWLDSKKHGNGLIVTSDGVYYEGIFNQDTLTGQGVMILEDGTHYEGEFRGMGLLYGKGILTLPSGHTIEGNLSGTWNESIKISNGIFNRNCDNKLPKSFKEFCTPVQQKWKALFRQCHQILGISYDVNNKNNNQTKPLDTQKIWQNVAIYLSNASVAKIGKSDKHCNKFQNTLNHLDIIPPYGREKLDVQTFNEIKNYLNKAFESNFHPLGSLLNDLSEAYATTYEGRVHPLLLSHAIGELHYVCKRLYEIVKFLFPALPAYEKDCLVESENGDEVVNYQSLLYPIILPKVHHPLFSLLTLKNEQQERQYKRTLMDWNKQSDYTLMSFLSVDQKFVKLDGNPPNKNHVFEEAFETLQQLKSTFSPIEKLLVIRQTVEKMTPVAQEILGKQYVWNMDDLFPIFLFVVVRARIPDLGSELDFIDNFMDPSLESGELGIMYTTLKACYQQILQEKTSSY